MKFKKTMKTYCRKCKSHKEHKVSIAKSGGRNKTHPLSRGSRRRMRLRGLDRGSGNKGRISRGAVSSWKRTGAKLRKKADLKLTCNTCQSSQIKNMGRTKKMELV